jgi:energy-converting hydrogenase Eha subunit C
MPDPQTIATPVGAPAGRPAGIALLVLGAASLGLLANHPSGAAQTFAEVLREESANRIRDALVHGGFIVVLAAELVCLAIFSMRLGLQRSAVVAGLVLTSVGAVFLMLSMLLDGLVTPAIATRYVDVVERHGDAKTLFVLLGAVIGTAMPVGLLFQAAGTAFWSAALLLRAGLLRSVGIFGVAIAALVIVGVAATAGRVPHVLIGAIVASAVWYALVGLALIRRRV